MDLSLTQIIAYLQHFRYLVILPLGVAEGPILSIICGFLIKLGYLGFWGSYLVLILADLIGDVLWYSIGRFGAHKAIKKFGHFVSLDEPTMLKIEKKFKNHQNKALLISKMTGGFGFALVTLTVAGIIKIDFKKYMLLNFVGGFVWTSILIAAGYFFGHLYNSIDHAFRLAFVVGVALLVGAMLFGMQKYFRQKTLSEKL